MTPGRSAADRVRHDRTGRAAALYLAPITVFYLLFLVLPYGLVLRMSFYRFSATTMYVPGFTLANYAAITTDPFYLTLLGRTLWLGFLVTVLCLLLGYPLALKISRSGQRTKTILLVLTLSPLLINLIVRSYAWLVLMGENGVINQRLLDLGVIAAPLPINNNMISVTVGLVHISLPLMVISLVSVLDRIDPRLTEAAESLGAAPGRIIGRILLPLSLPGIAAGATLVFCFTISAFITPALLGGNRVSTLSTMIYSKFIAALNWPVGATLVCILTVVTLLVVQLHTRLFRER